MSAFDELLRAIGARRDEPLAPHTTFRIGGPAALYVVANTLDELVSFARLARAHGIPVFILGNGSNILVRDGGLRGLVIENYCNGFALDSVSATRSTWVAESGASLPFVANTLARQGWAGLEWSIGVPGTIGAAVVGNAGAHGGSIADGLISVTVLDVNNETREMQNAELGFEYRSSIFKKNPGAIILSVRFELCQDDPGSCIARMNQYTEHRRRTQPTEPSVGSMFKNPLGDYAGRLIEQAGLKGTRVGNVEVSQTHANFFVNRGDATAKNVLELIELVRAGVKEKFGVELELEIEVVGEG